MSLLLKTTLGLYYLPEASFDVFYVSLKRQRLTDFGPTTYPGLDDFEASSAFYFEAIDVGESVGSISLFVWQV